MPNELGNYNVRKRGYKMEKIAVYLLSFIFCLLSFLPAYANNIAVSNVSLTDQNASAGTVEIQFDISWDNSWRTSTNYDAAWVFIKYSTDSGTTWNHATLKTSGTNPLSFTRGTGTTLDIVVPADKKGAFLQRSGNDSGSVSTTDIEFVWDWTADGLSASTTARVKVFAVEMVYIPTASFSVGDPNGATGPTNCFYTHTTGGAYSITSEGAINVGAVSGYLYYDADNVYAGDQSGPVPAAFPKGYSAFYMMKYEISQGQYADFLNVLTSVQASTRFPNNNGVYRHTISGTYPNHSVSRADRACNYLSWSDLYAYADWTALRPFTELEFEKAARGPASAVANEYAWGSTSITEAIAISGVSEDGAETITTAGANCTYTGNAYTGGDATGQSDVDPYSYTRGPLRCGIFATSSTTRQASGAGYYGAMELSGNLYEFSVTAGNAEGRSFTGEHGDGNLTTTPSGWPSSATATGSGFRGGTWLEAASFLRVSDRSMAAFTLTDRFPSQGGRCVRTSP
jgi:formylglycine-generating enzyme required for sulfatase activity